MKAWNARHKEECIRVGGISQSPNMAKGKGRIDSPTPATDANKGKVPLKQLMDPRAIRKDQKVTIFILCIFYTNFYIYLTKN